MSVPTTFSAQAARRLAVTRQHLSGTSSGKSAREQIVSVLRDLVFVQWDPISVVAPSHILALWNRVRGLRPSDLDRLLWEDKKLFLHWANLSASIVLTEDYPLYYSMMKRYPESMGKGWGAQQARAKVFLAHHRRLGESMLKELERGPLQVTEFRGYTSDRGSAEWTPGSAVSTMLFHLHMSGKVMVVGHEGNRNVWGLSEQFLPDWSDRSELTEEELERKAAQRAVRALGTASPREIQLYFPRGRYLELEKTLRSLREDSVIHPVRIQGLAGERERFVHDLDVGLLESLDEEDLQPRVSLLPPFDNLITGRGWTRRIFGFDYRLEIFFPEHKRRFGYYVLPVLRGDRLIGRIDPWMDRSKGRLVINSVHSEPGVLGGNDAGRDVADAISRLAGFLGATEVAYSSRVPAAWRASLR